MSLSDQKARSTPTGPQQFRTTHWSVVLAAGRPSSPQARDALSSLCQVYWYPLYAYIRRKGRSPADAQDLTQEFFAWLLEKNLAGKADRSPRPVPIVPAHVARSLPGKALASRRHTKTRRRTRRPIARSRRRREPLHFGARARADRRDDLPAPLGAHAARKDPRQACTTSSPAAASSSSSST